LEHAYPTLLGAVTQQRRKLPTELLLALDKQVRIRPNLLGPRAKNL